MASLLALVVALCDSVTAHADSTAVSTFTKSGTDSTTGSSATSGGPAGSTQAGDTINWVLHYTNNTSAAANVSISDPIGANQSYVAGSLSAPPGLSTRWSTGGSSWVSTEPGSGVNAVGATGVSVPGSTGAEAQASPPAAASIAGGAAGDGWEPLFVGNNIYNVRHITGGGTLKPLDCHVRATGTECTGYPAWVPSTAGLAFNASGNNDIATGYFENADVVGSKIYFPAGHINTNDVGVACADVSTQTSCGFTRLDTISFKPTSLNAGVFGGAVIGSKYYLGSVAGNILCFDTSTNAACPGYPLSGVADPTLSANLSGEISQVESFDGRHLFGSWVRSVGTHDLICVDVTTNQSCAGFPKTPYATGTANSMTLVPILDPSGNQTGICANNSTSTTVHTFQCYDMNGTAVPTPFSTTQTTGTVVNAGNLGSVGVVGSRVYFAEAVQSTGKATYTCWDYATAAPCADFTKGSTGAVLRPYTIRQDPQSPDCLWQLGDAGQFESFSATFGLTNSTSGCNESSAQVAVAPASFYCDGQSGHVAGWNAIVLGGIGSGDYDAAAVTITDANGDPVPGWQSRIIPNTQQSIDISSIPYSGSTATLHVSVAISWGSHAVKPVTVRATFTGDAPEVCFRTVVGPSTCQPAPVVPNDAIAVTNGGAGASDAPGGNGSGTATFNEAPDTSSCHPSDSIKKIARAADGDQKPISVGEKVYYSYLVTNTGNVDIASFAVDDAKVGGVSCPKPPAPGLAPGDSETCTANAPYTVTQADVDAGGVSNTATVSCTDRYGERCAPSNKSSTHVPSDPRPTVAIDKSAAVTPAADQAGVRVGDSIQYTYRVTNTGNIRESSLSVDDPTIGSVRCPVPGAPGLAPGASEICTAVSTHTVTQADVDAGKVVDSATAGCKDTLGKSCPKSTPSSAVVPAASGVAMTSIQKIANASGGDQAPIVLGEQIQYSYLVTNTGNVTIASVSVTDPTGGPITCPALPAGGLGPGHSVLCTANAPYPVTQADVDTGSVTDTASSGCTDTRGGQCAPAPPSSTTVPGSPDPIVAVDKTATVTPAADASRLKVGDKVSYSYTVYNIGNVDLSSVSVSDPTIGAVSCPTPAAPGLIPGASVVCNARSPHTVSQTDVDAGSVSDTASAGCADSAGDVCGPSNRPTVIIPTVAPAPLTSVHKSAKVTPSSDQHHARPGDKIRYLFKVTNVGNVDLTKVTVSDPALGPVSCPVPRKPGLAPHKSETCTGTRLHRVTATDLKHKKVANIATSRGTDPRGQVSAVSGQSKSLVPIMKQRLELRKLASRRTASAGQAITYTLRVTNPGASTVSRVTVCDTLPGKLLYMRSSPRARLSTGRYCWTIKTLKAHAHRSFTLTTDAAPSNGGNVTNHATANAKGLTTARAAATVKVNPARPIGCGSASDVTADAARRHPIAHVAC